MAVVFGHFCTWILPFVRFFHLEMSAFAIACQDNFSIEDVCICSSFSLHRFSFHCTAESCGEGKAVQLTAICFFCMPTAIILFMLTAVILCMLRAVILFILTAVQEQRSRLFYLCRKPDLELKLPESFQVVPREFICPCLHF